MQANYVQRLRLTFSKNGPARYIGHLDLARTMERSLNRAQVPIAYSQGFNRRPRLSFAAALPLGYTSEYELADIWLLEDVDPRKVMEQMMPKMAPGIVLTAVKQVPLGAPSLQSITASARYEITPLENLNVEDLSSRINQLLAEKHLIRERKSGKGKVKQYNLRPLIIEIVSDADSDGNWMLRMTLFLMPGKTGRPDEVLAAINIDPLATHIHRTMITLLEDKDS
jgi:radical SAM-linked protein